MGKISKMGNPALRSLLVVGATAVLQHARRGATISPWLTALLGARNARHRIPLDPGKSRGSSMRVVLWVPTVDDFPCFFPETGRFSKKNREAIEHERAITERD